MWYNLFMAFDIEEFVNSADKVWNSSITEKENARAWAWYDCQNAFNNHKLNTDYRAKELFIYLANWGMVARGSFLMKHNWRILKGVVEKILEKKRKDLLITKVDEIDQNLKNIANLYKDINDELIPYRNAVQETESNISSRLITKILLGTTGCTVAYDTYVIDAFQKIPSLENAPHEINSCSGYSQKSLRSLYNFYFNDNYKDHFDRKLKEINSDKSHPEWTIMKLMDACLCSYLRQ